VVQQPVGLHHSAIDPLLLLSVAMMMLWRRMRAFRLALDQPVTGIVIDSDNPRSRRSSS
jgi:hypothetical protein